LNHALTYALALATALLLILIHPGASLTLLAPVALAPLLIACSREPRAGRRFLVGWVAGIVYWWGVCYWIQFVLEVHGAMGVFGSWGAFVLFCLAKALHFGVFAMCSGWLLHRWYAIPAIAALWTGIERTHGPLGFAWLTLGNAGVDMSVPARLAPWVGVYGLSFVFAMMATAFAGVVLRRPRSELIWVALLPLMLVLPDLPTASAGTESAVVLQPNIAEGEQWTHAKIEAMQDSLVLRSLQSSMRDPQQRPRLIVWPELPGPLYYYDDPRFHRAATDLARTTGTHFLFGTVAYTVQNLPLNSAVMLAPDGTALDRYDKMFLVPFGEFIPPLFSWVNRITNEAGDFVRGSRVVVFPMGDRKLGTFICYESAFPHLVRRFALAGADVLANISNDGYFGTTAARYQHLKIARMRAVENRRWILRATNDGITATIDPAGRITQTLPPFGEQVMTTGFGYVKETTFYTRHGDWFAWSCLIFGIGLAGFHAPWRRALRRQPASPVADH
jgi:apolipoprotein N-acyltransferase